MALAAPSSEQGPHPHATSHVAALLSIHTAIPSFTPPSELSLFTSQGGTALQVSSAWAPSATANRKRILPSPRPHFGTCVLGVHYSQPTGDVFVRIPLKMFHISVKRNRNKRAACSNNRECCLPGGCSVLGGL